MRVQSNPVLLSAALLFSCGCGDGSPGAEPASSSVAASGAGGAGAAPAVGGAGVGGAGGGLDPDPCEAQASEFQALLDQGREEAGARGAVLAITTASCGLWSGASGESTDSRPMDPAMVLRMGSVTKTFVASTVLQLSEEGKLALDDLLADHWPAFPAAEGVTLRQLLNHTSGIFNYTDDDEFQTKVIAEPLTLWTPEELVALAAANPPYFAPGAGWHYSNTNYLLLGLVIEAVTGSSVAVEIRARFLDELPLAATSFDGEEAIVGDLAHGYASNGADVTTKFDPSMAWAAGAMVASAGDLSTWARNLYGGSVLEPASVEAMLTGVNTDQPGLDYGLGAFVMAPSIALDTAYGHGGDIFGYHTHMFYLPNQDVAFAAIVNDDGASPNAISVNVLEALVQ
jgi:D-alanyl-D-alanine carboxypeptidase